MYAQVPAAYSSTGNNDITSHLQRRRPEPSPSISYITAFLDTKGSTLVDFLAINAVHWVQIIQKE